MAIKKLLDLLKSKLQPNKILSYLKREQKPINRKKTKMKQTKLFEKIKNIPEKKVEKKTISKNITNPKLNFQNIFNIIQNPNKNIQKKNIISKTEIFKNFILKKKKEDPKKKKKEKKLLKKKILKK